MPNEKNNSALPGKEAEKSETISELAHRHLKDEAHTTSDEELRNAKVEFTENSHTQDESLYEVDNTTVTGDDVTTNDDRTKDNDEGDTPPPHSTPPNPYTVLNP